MPPHPKRRRTEHTTLAGDSDDDLFDTTPLQLPSFMSDNIPVGGTSGTHNNTTTRPVEFMDLEDDQSDTHVTQLMRHWMNERFAPDLLQHCGNLLQTLLHRIREQARLNHTYPP